MTTHALHHTYSRPIDLGRWQTSRRMLVRSEQFLAGGISSNVRASKKPWPLFFERGEGARLYDADGNAYLDYLLGQGPLILGHCPAEVIQAVSQVLHEGQLFAGQHQREITVAERLGAIIPCAELVRFGSSGTEMVQAAIRLARAYTGRNQILKFEGHYHGWLDNVLVSVSPPLDQAGPRESPYPIPGSKGQDPAASANTLVLPWNDADLLRATFEAHGRTLAAVIMEPMMCNTHAILPQPGYLEEARHLCDTHGVVLIFDEIITGFRLGLRGAQGRFGVTPDLALFGKALAAGFPISCLAGKRPLMELIARNEVVHAGTFNSNLMVMAAAEATLAALSQQAANPYQSMERHGEALMAGIREIGSRLGLPLVVEGVPTAFAVAFCEHPSIRDYREYVQYCDRERYADFAFGLLARGVRVAARGIWYLSTAHTAADIEQTLQAVQGALQDTFRSRQFADRT